MKFFLATFALFGLWQSAHSQKIDSIYFNLYTDSLKKGTFNYINVDGKTSEGIWIPLTANEIKFKSSAGKFEGNSLFIDSAFKEEKIRVSVTLKSNPEISKEITIYVKKLDIPEQLRTKDEFFGNPPGKKSDKKKKGDSKA